MKFLTVLTLGALTLASCSHKHGHKHHKMMEEKISKMSYEEEKAMQTDMLTKKAAMIEESRKCVTLAKDKDALKECRKSMHEKKKAMMNEMKHRMKS